MKKYTEYLKDIRMVNLYKGVVEPILKDLGSRPVYFYDELEKGFEECGANPELATEIFSNIILENEEFLTKRFGDSVEELGDLLKADIQLGSYDRYSSGPDHEKWLRNHPKAVNTPKKAAAHHHDMGRWNLNQPGGNGTTRAYHSNNHAGHRHHAEGHIQDLHHHIKQNKIENYTIPKDESNPKDTHAGQADHHQDRAKQSTGPDHYIHSARYHHSMAKDHADNYNNLKTKPDATKKYKPLEVPPLKYPGKNMGTGEPKELK